MPDDKLKPLNDEQVVQIFQRAERASGSNFHCFISRAKCLRILTQLRVPPWQLNHFKLQVFYLQNLQSWVSKPFKW